MRHRHFLEMFGVWLSRGAAPRQLHGLQVREPPTTQKSRGFDLLSQISPLCKVLVTLTLCALGSPPPKSCLCPRCAAGEGGSPLRPDLTSPEPPLGFQPGGRGIGVFVPSRGSQTMVAPSTSPGCAWLPSPSAGLAVRALGGMHPAEIPQGFVPPGRKGKGRGGPPLPTAKEAAEKLGQPQLEQPRGLSHLGPQLGCRRPGGLLQGDPLLVAGLPW